MKLDRQPYELSIWTSKYIEPITDSDYCNGYFDEELVAIIGSNNMNLNPGRASNGVLTLSINGAATLTFDIYKKYFDAEYEEFIENPYFQYLHNESHLKLKYKNKWYDFIVKNISENDTEYSYNVTATDYFINELSKNGNSIEFSSELGNNMDTIDVLAKDILDGTDWELSSDSELLRQTVEELVYKATLSQSITANLALTDESITIDAGENIYIFYSVIQNKTSYFQFIYSDNSLNIDDNGIIINSEELSYYIKNVNFGTSDFPNFIASNPVPEIQLFKGEKLVRSPQTLYDDYTGKLVSVYEKNGVEYYCYEETEYVADKFDIVTNGLVNASDFVSTDGWTPIIMDSLVKTPILENSVDPKLDEWLESNPTSPLNDYFETEPVPYLSLKWYSKNTSDTSAINLSGVLNTGFQSNPEVFFEKDETDDNNYKTIPRGTTFIFRYKIHNYDSSLLQGVTLQIAKYTVNDNGIYTLESPLLNIALDNTNLDTETGYITGEGSITKNIYYEDSKNIGIFLLNPYYSINYSTRNFIDIQLFKKYIYNNKIIYPGQLPESLNTVITNYYFYTPNGAINGPFTSTEGYEQKYNDDYRKIRSIEASETNRFDLIQTLNEAFECWSIPEINREENGKIAFRQGNQEYVLTKDLGPLENKKYFIKEADSYINIVDPTEGSFYTVILNTAIYSNTITYYKKNGSHFYPIDLTEKEFTEELTKNPITIYTKNNIYEKRHRLDKNIKFSKYIGEKKYLGLYYGLNTNGIERTINSEEIITKLIVPNNQNEYGTNGFCSIARAQDNMSGANFLINFDYYYKNNLLDEATVKPKILKYLESYKEINDNLKQLDRDNQDLITKFYTTETNYNINQEIIIAAGQEIATLKAEIKQLTGKDYTELPGTNWTNFKQKYSDEALATVEAIGQQIVILQKAKKDLNEEQYKSEKAQIELYEIQSNRYIKELEALDDEFFKEFAPYIQEGIWQSDDYYDDNLYYYDALSSLNISKEPKVEYSIQVVDISSLEDCEIFDYNIGDRTFIQDRELFGDKNEDIIISEISYNLDDPTQNTIVVQNYKTEFADMFQKFSAATSQIEFKGGGYDRAAGVIQSNGTIEASYLNNTLAEGNIIFGNKDNKLTIYDNNLISWDNKDNVAKISGGKIMFSKDGGSNYPVIIDGDGIRADYIKAGQIDAGNILIGPKDKPNFRWDSYGIEAYRGINNETTFTKFVRFDQFGLYGIDKNEYYIPSANVETVEAYCDDIEENAQFGFVWDRFFLKTHDNGGMVKISSENDIQVFSGDNERIKIGLLNDDTYGLSIKNEDGNEVVKTDSDGNITIEGTISATAGSIGGFDIASNGLYKIDTGNNKAVYLNTDKIKIGTDGAEEFWVDNTGFLQAQNANILGKLTTSVFEKDTTRVVGGSSLFKNAEIIESIEDDVIKLINDNGAENFSEGDYVAVIDSSEDSIAGYGNSIDYYRIEGIDLTTNKITLDREIENYSSDSSKYLLVQITNEDKDNDWIIGINANNTYRPFNLLPNSLTFNEPINYNENTHKITFKNKVVVGDLSGLGLETDVTSGLYAENAYLTGSFYANAASDGREMYLNDTGFNLANALKYDEATDTLYLNASRIIEGAPPDTPTKEIESDFASKEYVDEIIEDVVTYNVLIESSRGNLYINRNLETTLLARVFQGGTEITNDIPYGSFNWKKYNDDGTLDAQWTLDHTGIGKTVQITNIMVDRRAKFDCEINIGGEN